MGLTMSESAGDEGDNPHEADSTRGGLSRRALLRCHIPRHEWPGFPLL